MTNSTIPSSSGKKAADDKHHKIVITSKARLNPSRAIDPKLVTMISQTPRTETEVPRDLPTNQSSSGDEDDHPMNPCRPPGKDDDSDSTSSDGDSHFFLSEQTKSSQRTKDEAAADRDEYRFATPLSEDVMRLDLTGMSRVERDWRTLTNVRPKTQTEVRILDRLIQMERFQTQTVELENGMRRPIGLRINSNGLLQAAPVKNARGRVPSRRGYPDFDNTRRSNAAPASADLICQLCLERHAVRSCVDNVYASRSRSTIDFDKYERVPPHGPSNRMGPTVQGRSSNPLAPGAFRGRAKLTNAGRAVRVSEYSGSTSLPLQPLQRVDEYASTIGGSTSAQPVNAPSDLIGAFNVLGLHIGQSSKGGGEYSSLKPTLTSNEVASGSRTVAGTTAAKGNLVIPTVNYRKTPSIVDVEVRTLKPPRLKSATRTLKPGSKRRPQTAN